jgi:hypothetical protein
MNHQPLALAVVFSTACLLLPTPALGLDKTTCLATVMASTATSKQADRSSTSAVLNNDLRCTHITAADRLVLGTAAATASQAAALAESLQGLPKTAALARLDSFMQQSELDLPQREAVLWQFINAQRPQAESPAIRALLRQLGHHSALVTVPDPDHPGQLQAAFPIARTARGVLQQWDYQALCSQLEKLTAKQLLRWWHGADEQQREALLMASDNQDISLWQAQDIIASHAAEQRSQQIHTDETMDTALLTLTAALHSGDQQAVIDNISAVAPRHAISTLRQFDPTTSRQIYIAAQRHPHAVVSTWADNRLQPMSPSMAAGGDSLDAQALLSKLADTERGAVVAMQLALSLSLEQVKQLQAMLRPEQTLLQARLQTISDLQAELR